jgi:hypothetical protein
MSRNRRSLSEVHVIATSRIHYGYIIQMTLCSINSNLAEHDLPFRRYHHFVARGIPFSLLMVSKLYNRANTKHNSGPQVTVNANPFHLGPISRIKKYVECLAIDQWLQFYINLTVRGPYFLDLLLRADSRRNAGIALKGLTILIKKLPIFIACRMFTTEWRIIPILCFTWNIATDVSIQRSLQLIKRLLRRKNSMLAV